MPRTIQDMWVEATGSMWPRKGRFTAGEYDWHLIKFAELIVKECAELIDIKRDHGLDPSGDYLKQQFEASQKP